MFERVVRGLRLFYPYREDPHTTMPSNEGTNGVASSGQTTMPSVVNDVDGILQSYAYPEATPKGTYEVLDQYHSKPQRLRVACVGAGASGLCLAYKMQKMLEAGSWELTLFEKNKHFGGTWYEV